MSSRYPTKSSYRYKSDMSKDAAPLHLSFFTKWRSHSNGQAIDNGSAAESAFELRCSWCTVLDAQETSGNHYALVFMDVHINVQSTANDECPIDEPRYE